MKIQIINGPNLNLLGQREPGIYGSESFDSYLPKLRERFPDVEIDYYQSNIEGELINKMQETGFFGGYDGSFKTVSARCAVPLSKSTSRMSTSVRSSAISRSSVVLAWVSFVVSGSTPIVWLLPR